MAKLSIAATFPIDYFIENIAVRNDGSILVTVLLHNEVYYIPSPSTQGGDPILIHKFSDHPSGIVEGEADIFYISTSGFWSHEPCTLHRLDLRSFSPEAIPVPEPILTFPKRAHGLNGSCALSPTSILCADSFADCIWRVDFTASGDASVRVWSEHKMLAHNPDSAQGGSPGVNGIKYHAAEGFLYFTTTTQELFARVRVDPETLVSVGEPEVVTTGGRYDDFIIDEHKNVAYVTTHRQNTIERVDLKTKQKQVVAGEPEDTMLAGPTAGAWSRREGEHGKIAFVTTDGGFMKPLSDGIKRKAMVLRFEV